MRVIVFPGRHEAPSRETLYTREEATELAASPPGRVQAAGIDPRVVFEGDPSFDLPLLKNPVQFPHHGQVAGLAGQRREGAGESAPDEALPVENLRVGQNLPVKGSRAEEGLQLGLADVLMPNPGVVDTVPPQATLRRP